MPDDPSDERFLGRALEATIRIALVMALVAWCFTIVFFGQSIDAVQFDGVQRRDAKIFEADDRGMQHLDAAISVQLKAHPIAFTPGKSHIAQRRRPKVFPAVGARRNRLAINSRRRGLTRDIRHL